MLQRKVSLPECTWTRSLRWWGWPCRGPLVSGNLYLHAALISNWLPGKHSRCHAKLLICENWKCDSFLQYEWLLLRNQYVSNEQGITPWRMWEWLLNLNCRSSPLNPPTSSWFLPLMECGSLSPVRFNNSDEVIIITTLSLIGFDLRLKHYIYYITRFQRMNK